MDYSLMSNEAIIKDLAGRMEQLRLASKIKETEMEKASGISRKTYYNFKRGATGLSLKNFIALLRALGELERLERLFPETESYHPSPRGRGRNSTPQRVRDKQKAEQPFCWGDEK